MTPEHEQRTAQYRDFIESYLQKWVESCGNLPQKQLFDAMGYSLLAGGKRLRPILTMEFCAMTGGDWKRAVPFAAAVEMVHTYSLIHDDLPCMDNDDYRRGRLSNHKVYGEAMAFLAGDGLLTDAFSVAVGSDLPPQTVVRAVQVLSRCAGSLGMVGGQVLDIQSESRVCSEQEVLDIQTRKTGDLIRAACILGVLAGAGSQEQIAAADRFASQMGLAFQIRDDMLDVIGNQQEMGKAVGMDGKKNTFVRLYGVEKCAELVQTCTQQALRALDAFQNADYMSALAQSLIGRSS